MTLSTLVKDLEVRLIGNKGTLLGASMILGGTISLFTGSEGLPERMHAFSISSIYLGAMLLSLVKCGSTTSQYYWGVREHLQRRGNLDTSFLEKVFGQKFFPEKNSLFFGYCDIQGAYLAAREAGQLDVFYDVKQRCTKNIVPNF